MVHATGPLSVKPEGRGPRVQDDKVHEEKKARSKERSSKETRPNDKRYKETRSKETRWRLVRNERMNSMDAELGCCIRAALAVRLDANRVGEQTSASCARYYIVALIGFLVRLRRTSWRRRLSCRSSYI